jgi:hypothetical protein
MKSTQHTIHHLSLARGEQRYVYLRTNTVLVDIRGAGIIHEAPIALGEGCLRIPVALYAGGSHQVRYGGWVCLEALAPLQLRCIEPAGVLAGWAARLRTWRVRRRHAARLV